jgi:hypothetical protein
VSWLFDRSPLIRKLSSVSVSALLLGLVLAGPSVANPAGPDGHCPTTAAGTLGWGSPNRVDDFNDRSSLNGWQVYDTAGHAGNGRRTPAAVSVADGQLVITGDPAGNSGGMAWRPGQLYGRWEACAKSPPASPNYHSVLLLWPDNIPADSEIDFMEIPDPQRQTVTGVLHFDKSGERRSDRGNYHAEDTIDATQWHSWAVEWATDHVTYYVDGVRWFEVTEQVPSIPMVLCVQLDNFGGDISKGGKQFVDWARQYPPT